MATKNIVFEYSNAEPPIGSYVENGGPTPIPGPSVTIEMAPGSTAVAIIVGTAKSSAKVKVNGVEVFVLTIRKGAYSARNLIEA